MKKFLRGIAGAFLLLGLISCGPGQKKSEKMDTNKETLLFPMTYESSEKEIDGGTMRIGVINSTPIKGIFSGLLQLDATDRFFTENTIDPELFAIDDNFMVTDDGLAKIDIDVDNKIVTLTLKDNLKWDDGEPLTVDDYIFTYEVLAHKDYTGVRYDDGIQQVIGIDDYHNGKSKTISGLEKVSDTVLKIHFKEMSPAMRTGAGGLTSIIAPKHYLADVPIKDLEKSEKIRLKPVGAGPYKVSQVIPGESVEFVPNPYYYKEKPKVEKLIIKVVPDSSALSSIKNGEYDIYKNITEDLYVEYKDFDNIQILGTPALYYQYLGFNLGHLDKAKGINVINKNAKMYDLNLRKAMGYAMNVEMVNQSFYHGLRTRANSPIPPIFEKMYNKAERFTYNPEKAKKLLDEAGYKDIDGDGIREDKNGKSLEIFFAMPAGGDVAEPISQQYIQDWAKVGLKVSLTSGRLLDGNTFWDKVETNNKGVDVWIAAWGVGSEFDLYGLYSKKSAFNFSRYTTDKNEELIKKVSSVETLKDKELWIQAIREWDENYMSEVLGFLPIGFRYELTPINNRVKFYTVSLDSNVKKGKYDALINKNSYKSTK